MLSASEEVALMIIEREPSVNAKNETPAVQLFFPPMRPQSKPSLTLLPPPLRGGDHTGRLASSYRATVCSSRFGNTNHPVHRFGKCPLVIKFDFWLGFTSGICPLSSEK